MEKSADIATSADAYLQSAGFRGVVLLAEGSEILLRKGYGLANEEWQIPNTPATKFQIGSATKQFTAAAVLRLVESGSLNLQAPIGELIGDLPAAWSNLTVHQLLNHTAGLSDHAGLPAKQKLNLLGTTPRELIGLIADAPLLFQPGTARRYSNTGYILLGMLIESISKQSYADYLSEQIFRPLNMADSGYDSVRRIIRNRASGYALQNGELQNARYLDMTVPFAAGALYSTVDDLLKWNNALHVQEFLSLDSYNAMTARYPETRINNEFYGYGLFITEEAGQACFFHGGGTSGFLSAVQYYPGLQASLVLLSNLFDPMPFTQSVSRLTSLILARP